MMRSPDKLDPDARRKAAARRTAWIVGLIALTIYAIAILQVVRHR